MKKFSLFLSLGLLFTSFHAAQAGIIYSQTQPEEPIGAFSSVDIPTIGQKMADNFVLQGTDLIAVRSLRFIGGYSSRNPPPLNPPLDSLPEDDFRIVFLKNTAGGPGPPVMGGDFTSVKSVSRTPTNGRLLNGTITPLEFVVDLGEGIALDASAEYWITITQNSNPDFGWSWARGTGIFDSTIASTLDEIATGPWTSGASGGMWLELSNNNVPESTTMSLLIISVVSVMHIRIRQ